jgi:hypothetical protein
MSAPPLALLHCTDPSAQLTYAAGSLQVAFQDRDALLIQRGRKPVPHALLIDLSNGWTKYVDHPALLRLLDAVVVPPLSPEDAEILAVLGDHFPRTVRQVDLEDTTALSRRTIGRRLRYLRGKGLTTRPDGERGGEALTGAGLLARDRLR